MSLDTHRTTCQSTYDTESRARVVADALAVETDRIDDDRSSAAVERDGRTVRVTVRAADLVALRAGCNTWLRMLDTAEGTADAAGSD